MSLLVSYLNQLDIVHVMQKMEAVSFSRFRRASKRLYRIADEAENLSVMVDRRLVLCITTFGDDTPRIVVNNVRLMWEPMQRTQDFLCPGDCIVENFSCFLGFTFRQLEITSYFFRNIYDNRFDFSTLKTIDWKRSMLIANWANDSLLELIQPRQLLLESHGHLFISKPLPASIKEMWDFYSPTSFSISFLQNLKYAFYYCPVSVRPSELIHPLFEYWYNENKLMLKILDVSSDYYCPLVYTTEGAIRYIENSIVKDTIPFFSDLHWEMVNSSVMHCARPVSADPQFEENPNIQMFNMTLIKRAKCKDQWFYATFNLRATYRWRFEVIIQIRFP